MQPNVKKLKIKKKLFCDSQKRLNLNNTTKIESGGPPIVSPDKCKLSLVLRDSSQMLIIAYFRFNEAVQSQSREK